MDESTRASIWELISEAIRADLLFFNSVADRGRRTGRLEPYGCGTSDGTTRYGMARRSRIADESTTGTQFSVNCKTYFHVKVAARSTAATAARETLSSPATAASRTLTTIPFQLGEPAVLVPFSSLGRPVQVAVNAVKGWGVRSHGTRRTFPAQAVRSELRPGNLCRKRNRECWPE